MTRLKWWRKTPTGKVEQGLPSTVVAPPLPPPPPGTTREVIIENNAIGSGNDQVSYSAGWESTFFDHYTATVGARLTLRFTGTRAELRGAQQDHHGIGSVSIDGGAPVDVDFYRAGRLDDAVIFSTGTLADGPHTVTLTCTGRRNPAYIGSELPYITFDRAIVRSSLPAPVVTTTTLPDSVPWDGRTRIGYAPGDLAEKSYTKIVSIVGAGMVEGSGGDPVANGNKLRSFLASTMSGTTGQVCVEIPAVVPQRYRISENVYLPGRLTLKGLGVTNGRPDPSKVTFEHTTSFKALFMVDGQHDVELFNLTHYVRDYLNDAGENQGARSSQGQSGKGNLWVQGGAQRFRAQDFIAWGSHDAAVFFFNAHNFTCNRVESRDSQSDAWHVSNGSSYGTYWDCKSVSSGDDGIGFVGYGNEGPATPHHHTVVRHTMLEQQPNGRGFGNIHCYSIRYFGPTLIEDSWAAGFICAREPVYGSGKTRDIKVYGELRIRRANKSPVIPHGAILIANDGTDGVAIEDIYFEGPIILSGTGMNRTGNPPQIGIRGAGPVNNVYFGPARFFNPTNDPDVNQTKFRADGTNKTAITLNGWSASTPTEPGAEPVFPLATT